MIGGAHCGGWRLDVQPAADRSRRGMAFDAGWLSWYNGSSGSIANGPTLETGTPDMSWKGRVGNGVADALACVLRLGRQKTYRFFLDALWERYPVDDGERRPVDISVYRPPHVAPDEAERPLVERIFTAYRAAKIDQRRQPAAFQPSSMWENILRAAYRDVTESIDGSDLSRFQDFLANFGSWREATAIEESQLIRQCDESDVKRRHVEQKIMAPLIRWWQRFESHGRGLDALEIPRHGNFGGVMVDRHLISPGSVFSDVHARLLAGFLAGFLDKERPVIGELGGGFGRLFVFLSRHFPHCRYVGFDLPETLCCASYYLMKSFPDKRFLLYGEQAWDEAHLQAYDMILLPSFELPKLPNQSIDLFINENSLGEVEASACANYVDEICRTANGFWHRNHEAIRFEFEGNTTSMLAHEYPVPENEFVRVARYPDVGPFVRADRLDHDSDMFWYYYRRRATGRSRGEP